MEAFCSHCGEQKFRRLELRRILGEVLGDLANFNSVWLRTLREMTLRPGRAVLAYVSGDRRRFVNPIKYLFVLMTLFAVIVIGLDIDLRPEPVRIADASDASIAGMHFVFSVLGYLAIVYLLPVAALQARLFRSEGLNVAEHYASLCFFTAQVQLFLAICALTGVLALSAVHLVIRVAAACYLVFWNARLFGRLSFGLAWRSLVVYVAQMLIVMFFAAVTIAGAILLGLMHVARV